MSDPVGRPRVMLHLGWPRDLEQVGGFLRADGSDVFETPPTPELCRLLAGGRPDLVVADAKGGRGPLGDLLATLAAVPEADDVSLVLLAEPGELTDLAALAVRRFGAVVLAKPVGPEQLLAAVRAGLAWAAGRRQNRELLRRLEASNDDLRAARDEAERRRAEADAERRRFHDLVQGLDSVVWEADPETGRFTFVSARAEAMFGEPVARWLDDPGAWLRRVHPEDRPYVEATRARALRDGGGFELEYRVVAADGRMVWLREAARRSGGGDGPAPGLRGLMWDITRRKKVERQLYTAKRQLAEQLDDMTYLHRLSTRLAATTELAPTLEEALAAVMSVVGAETGLVRLRDPDRGDEVVAASAGLPDEYRERFGRVAAGGPGAPDPEAARVGGYVAEFATPLTGHDGEPLGSIVTFFRADHRPPERQVRLVELYARLASDLVEHARLRRELYEADRRKDEFLATLALKLRNPLAAIVGAAHALDPWADDPSTLADTRDLIRRQWRDMTRLIDDLLDAARGRRGGITIRKVPVTLEAAVARSVEAARPLIDARGHALTVTVPPGPHWLEADPVRLEQVLVNLLTNAAKYTEPGGHIELTACREADDLVVAVRDDGIGIAPEVLPKVFELFAQADPQGDRARGGLGIGLAQVRSLVELHGGRLSASSGGPGLGSEFVVRLPAAEPPAVPAAPEAHVEASAAVRESGARRVLVVDDQPDTARSLARLLESWGHEAHLAHDGPSALVASDDHRPDLVLLDIGLPGMDGYEVARGLRRRGDGGPRVVALTGYGGEDDRRRSTDAGFDAHLVKPVDPDELRGLLDRG